MSFPLWIIEKYSTIYFTLPRLYQIYLKRKINSVASAMIEGKFKLLMNIEQYMQSSYWRCSLFRLTYHFKVKYELLLLIINLLETLPTTSCSRFVLKVPGLDSIPNCWSRWNWSSQQCEGWGATVPSDTCTGRCYTSLSLQDLYIGSKPNDTRLESGRHS